ncbi:MAG: TonB-dependent receptor [Acidobacteriota bacterium]|nr:TonB-dependent receptor [Acidobacteriota bacterium]
MKVALLAAALLTPVFALAQHGQLTGEVRDPHQAVVAGITVKVKNTATGKVKTSHGNAAGKFVFNDLAAGDYSLAVDAAGFKPVRIDRVTVAETGETTQNIVLELAGTKSSVTVRALSLNPDVKSQEQTSLLEIPAGIANDNIVFTAKDIEALHPSSLLDVLQTVPGVEITAQGRQHMDFMTMRGGSFQVIIDGVYLSQADRILGTVPVELVESMTIVRDSTALTIGPLVAYHSISSSGTGVSNQGFVIIRTKRSAATEAGFASSGGSYGTAMGHAYVGSKSGKWDYRGAYTYSTTAGRDRWNMAARNGSAMFHGGYASGNLTMDFVYYGLRGMRQFEYGEVLLASTGTSCTPKAAVGGLCATTMNMYKGDGDLFALNVAKRWNDSNRTTLQYGFDRSIINAGMLPVATGSSNEQDSTEGSVVLKHTYMFKKNELTGGGQFMKYIAPLGSAPTNGKVANRLDDAMYSWFVQDEYRFLGGKLVLDGSIRGDKLHSSNYNSTIKASSDVWGSTFKTIAFGATYKFNPRVTTSARYGLVTTPAASNDVYQTSSMTAPSTNLPNQTQNRGELTTEVKVNPHFVPNVALYLYSTQNATASASTCTNPSGVKNQSSWLNSNGNEIDCVSLAGTVTTAGTETGFSGRLVGPFKYKAGYGYIGTDNRATNKTMSHNFVDASLGFADRGYFANFNMVYVGPKWSASSPSTTYYGLLANYTRLDLNGGYNFHVAERPMTFTVFGRNLNNNLYATRYVTGAYRDPGRVWGVELAAKVF